MLNTHNVDTYYKNQLVANSEVIALNDLVLESGGTVSGATAGSKISGIAMSAVTAAADNETVAKLEVQYSVANSNTITTLAISGGTITIADEGKYFNLSDARTVDGTTESTVKSYVNTSDAGAAVDPVITYQVELVEFISATEGKFRIVNY